MTEEIKDLHMIPYNTGIEKLLFSEYGRHIQDMVTHCLSIEDREARNACAASIIDTMATLVPSNVGPGGDRKKLWDHLNIMSGFKLDIDWPEGVTTEEVLHPEPGQIPYSASLSGLRHYGRLIQIMARKVAEMENSPEKDVAVQMVATYMKKLLIMNNPQAASDAKVFQDLAIFTEGAIDIDPATFPLGDFPDLETPIQKAKKKKRK